MKVTRSSFNLTRPSRENPNPLPGVGSVMWLHLVGGEPALSDALPRLSAKAMCEMADLVTPDCASRLREGEDLLLFCSPCYKLTKPRSGVSESVIRKRSDERHHIHA